MLEKTLESPLDCKELQPVHSKGDQSWVFFGRNDAKAETPILWPPDAKSWLIWEDPDAGKDWGQEKWTTEDEMFGWHHQLDGHGFEWTPGVDWWTGRPGLLQFMGSQESDTTERLNWDRTLSMQWTLTPLRMPYNLGCVFSYKWVRYTLQFMQNLDLPFTTPCGLWCQAE